MLVKNTTTTTTTTKPTSCAVVFALTTDILQKNQGRGTKHQVEELKHDHDSDDLTSALYGGLDEDEDDEMEAADAALSPLKPVVAAQMSKVSSLHRFEFTTTLLLTNTQYCSGVSSYSLGSHLPNKRGSPQRDKAISNSPMAQSTMGGGHSYLSQLFFDMSVAEIGMSEGSNNMTPFKHYKQFGMKFTKDVSRITGGKLNTLLRLVGWFMKWYVHLRCSLLHSLLTVLSPFKGLWSGEIRLAQMDSLLLEISWTQWI